MRKSQRGFTLAEMMIVVAIVGVLATMAIVYMRPKVTVIDVATRFGDLVREGNRRAVALGPVRANVALAQGSRARTRIVASGTPPRPTFTLQRLQEDTNPSSSSATWVDIQSYTVHDTVDANFWAPAIGSAAQTAGSQVTSWSTFVLTCSPDGRCDPRSLYFRAADGKGAIIQSRVSVMPLGGAIMIRQDWN